MTKSALSKLIILVLSIFVSVGCVHRRGVSFADIPTYQVEPAAVTPKVETLPNGVRLVVTPFTGTSQAVVEVLYGIGSAHDVIPGTAHFLEHMMFRGTVRRPHQTDVSSDIKSLGGTFNAYTADDNTAYHIKTSAEYIAEAIDILHDMVTASRLSQEDIDVERFVVARENLGYLASPDRAASENLDALMIPTSRSSADDVAALPEQRLHVVTSATATQAHLYVGLSSIGLSPAHHASAATTLVADVLGGDMSSRLFQTVRTQLGLTYGINAHYYGGSDQLQIDTTVNADRLAETLTVIVSELKRLRDDRMTSSELALAKIGTAAENLRRYETLYGIAHVYGYSYLASDALPVPGAWGQVLRSVTPMETVMAARALLRTSRLYVSVVVPPGTTVPYEAIMSQLGE